LPSILLYFILLFILFYFILFFILFFILLCFALLCFILLYSTLFYSTLLTWKSKAFSEVKFLIDFWWLILILLNLMKLKLIALN